MCQQSTKMIITLLALSVHITCPPNHKTCLKFLMPYITKG